MKNKILLSILLAAAVFIFNSCEFGVPDEENPDLNEVTVSGQVVETITGNAINNAGIKVSDGERIVSTRTGTDGKFSVPFLLSEDKEILIVTYLEGYSTDTTTVYAVVGSDVNVPLIKIRQSQGSGGGTTSGAASSIRLVSLSATSIGVIESGSNETAQIIFEVLDSTGVPINSDNSVVINFTFGAVPGGGEYLYPSSVQTNALGRATVTVNTGTKAGVAQIIAEVNLPNRIIRSEPILMAIHGGFPDPGHFAVASDALNYPLLGIIGAEIEFTAFAGDKYSNPVRPGTAVYFNTNSGIIAGSAQTDELGRATVTLITQPFPVDPLWGPGFFTVEASTIDENETNIVTGTARMLSGAPIISNVAPSTFTLGNGGSQDFIFTVSDVNGNPLAAGTTISVSAAEGDIKVSGNNNITLPDTQSRTYTSFSFNAYDSEPGEDLPQRAEITISVSGPNGTDEYTIVGSSR